MGKSSLLARSSLYTTQNQGGGNKKTGLGTMNVGQPFNLRSVQARLPYNLTAANKYVAPSGFRSPGNVVFPVGSSNVAGR
mgnify:CR=1 FL=1|jgi:hypothetical protein